MKGPTVKTVAIFTGGMCAGAVLLYGGMLAYFTADWWFPRRWMRQRPGERPIEDVDLHEEEWGPTR